LKSPRAASETTVEDGPSLTNRCSQPLAGAMTNTQHVYEVRPRKDRRGVDLISDALPFGRLWYDERNAISNAIDYAKFFSRSHDAVIRVYERFELFAILAFS